MIVYTVGVNRISPVETQAMPCSAVCQHMLLDNPCPEILFLNEI